MRLSDEVRELEENREIWFRNATEIEEDLGETIRVLDALVSKKRGSRKRAKQWLIDHKEYR